MENESAEDMDKWKEIAWNTYGHKLLCYKNHNAVAKLLADIDISLLNNNETCVSATLNSGELHADNEHQTPDDSTPESGA
jgi:hypothetical protein